jgi:sirohydrochlorin cobaltochelatase
MVPNSSSALLIVGHGSTVNPDSSAPTLAHAAEIRRQGVFRDVRCAFWKEEPSLRDALFLFDPDEVSDVYVVPNFISEGYFTQTVIPRELELSGRTTRRSNGQQWHYCPPVGSNSSMTELLLHRARDVAQNVDPRQTSLLIVAHGTDLNENSAVAAKREADKIRALGEYAVVLNVYMEESPLVSDWEKLTSTRNVLVVPFFISDGLHSYEDIPVLLGIKTETTSSGHSERGDSEVEGSGMSSRRFEPSFPIPRQAREDSGVRQGKIFQQNPYEIHGRRLFYASAIGTDVRFARLIIEQATSCAEANQLQSVS